MLTISRRIFCLSAIIMGCWPAAYAQSTPSISGANAFWYFGSGILKDGSGCATLSSPCYYAQATWTANANGHSGTPTWSIATSGGANVSLSCTTCATTLATSTHASNGCNYDLTVSVTYPDGAQSDPFYVAIITPQFATLRTNYPQTAAWTAPSDNTGYQSTWSWQVTDACSQVDSNLDFNESFGTFTVDYTGTNWSYPTPNGAYQSTGNITDVIASAGNNLTIPRPMYNATPGSVKVYHDYVYHISMGSQTIGAGAAVTADTQQWWQDHGTHQ